jgi:hypothetical protein
MMASIFIMPHERGEALEAYRDRLTEAQVDEIDEAPETAIIKLDFGVGAPGTLVTVIEEG